MLRFLKAFLIGAGEDAVNFSIQFGHWMRVFGRWLRRVFHRITRFLHHFIVVERRIHRLLPKLLYPFRLLRFLLKHYHLLPDWVKALKFALILIIILMPYSAQVIEKVQKRHAIYERYYPHFYEEYRKTLPDDEAAYYADFYASYFAEYYASDKYKAALQYALPEATPETVSYPVESKVAELAIDDRGLTLIKEFEGLVRDPYLDVGGKLTIGYGHLIRPGEFFDQMNDYEAEKLLREDIKVAEAVVKRNVQVELSPAQFSALVSLVYNIGSGHFEESTLLRRLNRGQYRAAADEFLRWDHVGRQKVRGLTRRRAAERALFLKG